MTQNPEKIRDAVEIRDTTEADLDTIAETEAVCFGVPWTRAQLAESLKSPVVVMKTAFWKGKPAGYLCAVYLYEEAEIQRIAVSPEYRRKGIASVLMDCFFAEKAPQETFLDVRASNTAARTLYEGKGFVVCGQRKNYYGYPAEDAVLMRRSI